MVFNPVKTVCDDLEISQRELADLVRVSEGTVNRWHGAPGQIPESVLFTFDLLMERSKYRAVIHHCQQLMRLAGEMESC